MSAKIMMVDGTGTRRTAKVTIRGQVVSSPLEYSKFYPAATASNNVAVNVVPPIVGKQFIITDIILAANRDVTNSALVDLFEASSSTSASVVTQIYQDDVSKQGRAILTGLNIIVSEGLWVNVKSDDVIVRANIGGYYADSDSILTK